MRELLDGQDWDDTIERLTAYANFLVGGLSWLQARAGLPPGGKSGEDYAMEAIRKLFDSERTGKRKWDPERVSLYVFLKGVVRSDVSTDVDSVENANTVRPKDGFDPEHSDDSTLLEVIESFSGEPNVVRAIELYMDGETDEAVKCKLGVKRAELNRIKSCLRDYFDMKPLPKQVRITNR
ncbi:MAG: hypothetical protein KIS66_06990 [Fimbriimonadaceae bacterium]|nr:hypothetical protein [Fimbriimonadaceae bacterium]